MRMLVADWTIWSGPITIVMDDSSSYSTSHLYTPIAEQMDTTGGSLSLAGAPRATHVNLAIEKANACTQLPDLLHWLLNSRYNGLMKSLALYTPASMHEAIIQHAFQASSWSTNSNRICSCIESITLRDPLLSDTILLDQQPIMPLAANNIKFKHDLIHWLAQSHKSLIHLDIPSLPIDWFTEEGGNVCFEKLEMLTVTVNQGGNDEEEQHGLDGRLLKQVFPCLKDLTVHLPCADQFSLLLPILSDKQLYPWIESITIICPDDDRLRKRLPQQDISALLSSLKGVSRINAGWDMVVLDEI